MFGAVTAADIHDKLAAAGFEIDKRKILLHTPVKTLGQHTVKIKLHADVTVELTFDVVRRTRSSRSRAEARGRAQDAAARPAARRAW